MIVVVDGGDAWSAYLKHLTSRPGWSVARLARESGLHRSTIFGWIKEGAEAVTIQSVYLIADAVGDDRCAALRAAGNCPADRDAEIDLILSSNRPERDKVLMIERLQQRRAEERARRMADLQWWSGNFPDEED